MKTPFTLPEDLIFTEILPRVSSVNSLLKFKSVSKPWCSVISSEKFAKIQLEKSSGKSTSLTAVMISLNDEFLAVNHCNVDDLFSHQDIVVDQFEIDYPISHIVTDVVGSCNGLYCILLYMKQFILLNPCTRKFHKLPPLSDEERMIRGYGYGESNGDYKIFAHFWIESSSTLRQVSKLYSLKTDTWKTVEGPDFYCLRLGVLVNDKLHWAKHIYPNLKIVSFDLGSEMVGVVEEPSCAHGLWLESMCDLQGCLCLIHCGFSRITDVWVMKEYGVKESWCKVMTLPDFGCGYHRVYRVPIPIFVSKKGEILAVRSGLFIYNSNFESIRCLDVSKLRQFHDIGIGIQSLVSPFPRGELNE